MTCGDDEEGLGVYGCARCKEKKKSGEQNGFGGRSEGEGGRGGLWRVGVGCIQEEAENLPDATAMPEGAEYRREQRLERERGEAGGGDCCLAERSGGGGLPAWGGGGPEVRGRGGRKERGEA